jgi:glycosyltransferase involved in cell wall biosynthesis
MADTANDRQCRVWIFNHYASPPDRSTGLRHFSFAREIVQRGGDVEIFAAGFGHDSGREERLSDRELARDQLFDGVRFVWLRTFPYRGNGWRRAVNMASYVMVVLVAQAGRPAPTVILGSTVHPFAALAGWMIAKLRGARFIYEVRDLWPQTLIDIGAMQARSPGARMLYAIESFLVRRAETVITVLPGMSLYLEQRGLPSSHLRYLPNGVDLADDQLGIEKVSATTGAFDDPLAPIFADLDRRHARGEVIFAWVGSHGLVNRLDIVLEAFHIASHTATSSLALLFVGDGPEKPSLRRLATDLGLTNVVFLDPIPKDRVPDLLTRVDVGVAHYTTTPVYRYGVSFNKIFDYMASCLPIAFACETFADPVAAAGAGVTVKPDDPQSLADAMCALAAAPAAERRRMGEAGRRYVERDHDLARISASFADLATCRPRDDALPG